MLRAQHLGEHAAEELELHLGRQLGIALTFVYSGPGPDFRDRQRRHSAHFLPGHAVCRRRSRLARRWPRVARSHQLRLRYDCAQWLSPDEVERVDRLLVGSLKPLDGWRWSYGYGPRGQLAGALRLVSAADDPERAYVRRCGAELALICAGIPVPRTRPLRLRGRSLAAAQIDALLLHRPGGGRLSVRRIGHGSAGRAARVDRRRSDQRRCDPRMPGARARATRPTRARGSPRTGARAARRSTVRATASHTTRLGAREPTVRGRLDGFCAAMARASRLMSCRRLSARGSNSSTLRRSWT